VDPSPLARESKTLGPQDLKVPLGAGTQWHVGSQDLKWLPGAWTRWYVDSRNLKWPPGAGTQLGVRDTGWAPGARTRLPPYPLIPLEGPGPVTQNQLREPPLALGVAIVLVALRPTPCSRLQL
jgi:hypothetical protein